MDPGEVIAATHGRRAIDNLKHLRPDMKENEMNDAVAQFERSILDFADHAGSSPARNTTSTATSSNHSGDSTPSLATDNGSSDSSTRVGSPEEMKHENLQDPPSAEQLTNRLCISELQKLDESDGGNCIDQATIDVLENLDTSAEKNITQDLVNAYEAEAEMIDRSIKILPGVKKLLEKLPENRYAVATSGAKTYGESLKRSHTNSIV